MGEDQGEVCPLGERTSDDIRPDYRSNESYKEVVPQPLVCALTGTIYEGAIWGVIPIGVDSDTVAAIALGTQR